MVVLDEDDDAVALPVEFLANGLLDAEDGPGMAGGNAGGATGWERLGLGTWTRADSGLATVVVGGGGVGCTVNPGAGGATVATTGWL